MTDDWLLLFNKKLIYYDTYLRRQNNKKKIKKKTKNDYFNGQKKRHGIKILLNDLDKNRQLFFRLFCRKMDVPWLSKFICWWKKNRYDAMYK